MTAPKPPRAPDRQRGWRDVIRPAVERIYPAARVVERVAAIAVHLQRPTIQGIVYAVGAGASALHDEISSQTSPGWTLAMLVSRGYVVSGFRRIGAAISSQKNSDDSETTTISASGISFVIGVDGMILFNCAPSPELFEWIRQVLDPVLPPAVEVRHKSGRAGDAAESYPLQLVDLKSRQGVAIWEATRPLLDGGRCILLDGRPGVGKTTMAQQIAGLAGLGRPVMIESRVIGNPREGGDSGVKSSSSSGDLADSLRLLSPGVVIVDDVDKVYLHLSQLEALRRAARLVILTANNGKHDEVLDGALLRAGRVDEVFTVEPENGERRPPFDRLSGPDWDEVREWPIAYLNEVEKRLTSRPDNLRLDDLRERLAKKTRSGDRVY